MANRLTQNPGVTVLVIESGQDGQGDPRLTDPAKLVRISFASDNFRKSHRFPTLNSDFVAATSPDLTWGLATTNQTIGGLAHNITAWVFLPFYIQCSRLNID